MRPLPTILNYLIEENYKVTDRTDKKIILKYLVERLYKNKELYLDKILEKYDIEDSLRILSYLILPKYHMDSVERINKDKKKVKLKFSRNEKEKSIFW